ncbi:MAG: hypothetical protein SCI25_00025 [Desulfuromonadales bacterium]|nr:hypothetical protein [Desulfuromonadales bacterium]MDW7758707.1 hypothetical protein [Desulfuromonadales bacterium]
MIQYLEGKGLAAHCPECGAVVAPRNISSEDITGWFRLFSRCPNAMCCIQEANCYRAECERLVFYPGCLTFLWRAGDEISRGIQQVLSLEKDHK